MPSAVLAEVVRSGFVEGVHRGSLVILAEDGSVLFQRGHPGAPMFARSANKLMQASSIVENGAPLHGELLALAASSHSGEDFHIAGVRKILALAGLDESALQTPPELPYGESARDELLRAGGVPERITMNCSGKHAAMLLTCVHNGWDTHTYLEPNHPMQVAGNHSIERLTGDKITASGIDGCGAPVVAVSLAGVARAYCAAVQAASATPERRVADAMRAFPQVVGGTARAATDFMAAVPGLLVKDGAEGVMVGALSDGRAFGLKVDDGSARAVPVLIAQILLALGISSRRVEQLGTVQLLGGGLPVGNIRSTRAITI